LPISASNASTGVASSDSQLPRSRSRTRVSAPSINMLIMTMTPTSPGTIVQVVRLSGL